MSRTLEAQIVTYTFANPADPEYKVTRRLNNIDTKATDQQILTIGQAFATLVPGDILIEAVLTQQSAIVK
ncbi:DUF1659 domain-containing protein [Lacticaseibacillus saniviri]|uniref:DUF1659 domain-containing protein n=1 Tax=Lacticaseibacillus saniviri JCM 17471 = DSM 24301 TaxID=1293598 RepID=A0A0R2MS95_9LACO|nr:DUF1659 domain-containing protein [Lacticaseibacillus saniviri]KRO15115.1 hypothetical protein IV56_GL000203 [Lacticaseibacillus saniviri JCM 17471 = DSM 24301]MCG4282492.1 DUF1659 domain-containing protein [Lacticaseibacillus saniviri]